MITAAARKYMDASSKKAPAKKAMRHQRYGVMTVLVYRETEIILFHSSIKGLEEAYNLITRGEIHFDPSKASPVKVTNRKAKQ